MSGDSERRKARKREYMREYYQRPDVRVRQRERRREYKQRQKIAAYAADVARERGISIDAAMALIGATPSAKAAE